jgi:hypothetical protein
MEESKSHGPIHHTTNGTIESYHRINGHAMPGVMAGDAEYMPTAVVRRWGATKLPTKLILQDFSQSQSLQPIGILLTLTKSVQRASRRIQWAGRAVGYCQWGVTPWAIPPLPGHLICAEK